MTPVEAVLLAWGLPEHPRLLVHHYCSIMTTFTAHPEPSISTELYCLEQPPVVHIDDVSKDEVNHCYCYCYDLFIHACPYACMHSAACVLTSLKTSSRHVHGTLVASRLFWPMAIQCSTSMTSDTMVYIKSSCIMVHFHAQMCCTQYGQQLAYSICHIDDIK